MNNFIKLPQISHAERLHIKNTVCFIIYFIGIEFSYAQNYLWENHLCTNNITGIEQQGSSYWLTTYGGGLVEYKPSTGTTNFYYKHNSGIPSVFLSAIAIDSSGNKWLGTSDGTTGLIYFDGNNWTSYNTSNSPLPSNFIQCLYYKAGVLWIGTKMSLVSFDGTTWTGYTIAVTATNSYVIDNVKDIEIDAIGNVWICCWGIGLMKYNGTGWIVYNNSNIPLLATNNFKSVTFDNVGNVWVVEDWVGICKFNGSNWSFNFTSGWMADVKSDSSGNIFALETNGTLRKFSGNVWQNLGVAVNPPYIAPPTDWLSNANNLFVDDSNHVWAGIAIGLEKYDGLLTDCSPAIASDLTANSVTSLNYIPSSQSFSIAEVLSNFDVDISWNYILKGSGLTHYNGSVWNQFNVTDSCFNSQRNCVNCMSAKDSTVWMGIRNGVAYYNGNSVSKHFWTTPCNENERTTAIERHFNTVFAGTNKGRLNKFDGTNWSIISTALATLPGSYISSMAYMDSTLFVASQMGLLSWYDSAVNFIYNSSNSGLASDTINDILKGKPIWLATDQGLVKTNLVNWTVYDTSNSGIPSNLVSCITKDSLNNLWIGTKDSGVAMFDGNSFTIYNTSNSGLTSNKIFDIVVDNSNDIWIGTADGGLCRYRYGLWLSENPSFYSLPIDRSFPKLTITPNPFQSTTIINIALQKPGNASLYIFNAMGQKIKSFFINKLCPQEFTTSWEGTNDAGQQVSPGIYICTLKTLDGNVMERILMIR